MTQDKDRSGTAVLEVSRKIYETSLAFYPDHLRHEFGGEMLEVFEEQINDAYMERGLRGLMHVWLRTAREFFSVAIAGQIANRMALILGLGAAFVLMLWFGGYVGFVMETACGSCRR